ncbi:MAG: 50S ribosomal protein L22 [Actinomycetota bacterium]|nr:50S ribosomal protein L22 [Actinomycetota bacterium]
MPGLKTNERPGTRAVLRHSPMSAYKAREVLDLIRGEDYPRAIELLEYCERGAADVIGKLLRSCAANAETNDGQAAEEMYVSACYADEGATLKRWRPRARGRATRIRKRTCHITVILSRLPEDEIARRRAKAAAEQSERRARRVAGTRRAGRQREAAAATEGAAGGAWVAETAAADALGALQEAREIESESYHAELESEAESALNWAPSEGAGTAGAIEADAAPAAPVPDDGSLAGAEAGDATKATEASEAVDDETSESDEES